MNSCALLRMKIRAGRSPGLKLVESFHSPVCRSWYRRGAMVRLRNDFGPSSESTVLSQMATPMPPTANFF